MDRYRNAPETGGREVVLSIRKACKSARKRIVKKQKKQEKEYDELRNWLYYKQIGDSLLAEAGHLQKGLSRWQVTNVHTQTQETVPVNPRLDAFKNAEIYYKKARKGKRGADICKTNLHITETELQGVESLIKQCDDCLLLDETTREFAATYDAILSDVRESGLIPRLSEKSAQKSDAQKVPYRHFTIDRWDVYVGKNNTQNDELSTRFAKPRDIWCHVAAHAGSHVVLKREKNAPWPPKHVVEKMAALAVWFSKARHTSYAEVHVTEARYVHKRRKAPPGEVVLDRYKTVRVAPQSPQEMFKE